jgi:hypothetical protein
VDNRAIGLDVNKELQDLKEIILKLPGEVLGLHFKLKKKDPTLWNN